MVIVLDIVGRATKCSAEAHLDWRHAAHACIKDGLQRLVRRPYLPAKRRERRIHGEGGTGAVRPARGEIRGLTTAKGKKPCHSAVAAKRFEAEAEGVAQPARVPCARAYGEVEHHQLIRVTRGHRVDILPALVPPLSHQRLRGIARAQREARGRWGHGRRRRRRGVGNREAPDRPGMPQPLCCPHIDAPAHARAEHEQPSGGRHHIGACEQRVDHRCIQRSIIDVMASGSVDAVRGGARGLEPHEVSVQLDSCRVVGWHRLGGAPVLPPRDPIVTAVRDVFVRADATLRPHGAGARAEVVVGGVAQLLEQPACRVVLRARH